MEPIDVGSRWIRLSCARHGPSRGTINGREIAGFSADYIRCRVSSEKTIAAPHLRAREPAERGGERPRVQDGGHVGTAALLGGFDRDATPPIGAPPALGDA